MRDMESMGKELLGGIGAEKLKSIAESDDGKRLSKMVDIKAAEKAVKSGDMEQMKALLAQVLSSEEGRRLAEQISQLGN